jgi:hypothetical protein
MSFRFSFCSIKTETLVLLKSRLISSVMSQPYDKYSLRRVGFAINHIIAANLNKVYFDFSIGALSARDKEYTNSS